MPIMMSYSAKTPDPLRRQRHSLVVSARRGLRHIALSGLAAANHVTGRMTSSLRRPRVHILVLHEVLEDEADAFRRVLGVLSSGHHLVRYSEAVDRIRSGSIDTPYVALSFDDGLKSCLRAARIMEEFGASGCFFVCPPLVGQSPPQSSEEYMSWEDLEHLADRGHEIGGHTMRHPNLAATPAAALAEEIGAPLDVLRTRLGEGRHFAWPYGHFHQFSALAAKTVFDAGYASCASAERGCHANRDPVRPRRLCLRRDNVVAGWPIQHIRYLLAKSSRTALTGDDLWPSGWWTTIADGE